MGRQRTQEGKPWGETEVGEREKERAEGGVKRGKEGEERRGAVGKGGGFVLGMRGRSLSGEEKLGIHQGEDFSTRAHPLIHLDRSSGPVFVTARTLDHL